MPSPPDAHVRRRALDVSTSFLVQAPAGSGKTELLTQRYLALLPTVEQPESIIAITFTRKAAGEMRSRISRALQDAASLPEPLEPHKRETWRLAKAALERDGEFSWGVLENPSRLRVITLDSLNVMLSRQMPWTSRFGGVPRLVEDPRELHREAALRTLEMIEGNSEYAEPLATLLLHLDNNHSRACELLMAMLARRDQWLRHFAHEPNREELEAGLQAVTREGLRRAAAVVPPLAFDLLRYACARCERFAAIRDWSGVPPAEPEALDAWRAVAALLLTDDGGVRKRITATLGFNPSDPRKPELVALLASLDEASAEALAAVRKLPPGSYSERQWEVVSALARILKLAAAQLQIVCRSRRQCDFIEAALRAFEALGTSEEPTPLAYSLDYRIQHLLIDEFQDTSLTQHQLLGRLTAEWQPGDGRTLFAVGDPMQSIYRFREADVGLFLQCAQDGLGHLPLEVLRLTANFRSSSELVSWFNASLPHALASEDDLESGAISYASSTAARGAAGVAACEVHPIAERDVAAEASTVADLVQAAEGDVAILVRARAHAVWIVRELNRRSIPFQAVEMDALAERAIVQDLRALTRALLHPADRVAWLSVLRAPWCGMSLAELHNLAGADSRRTIPELLADANVAAPRAAATVRVLLTAIGERGRLPLRRYVEDTWRKLNGPACLRSEAELADAETFLELLDSLDEAGDLRSFQTLEDELLKLCANPDPLAGARVQLMTMHKSKGLEFDNVILPGLGRAPRMGDGALLRWVERVRSGESLLLVGCIGETGADADPVYSYLCSLDNERERHEVGRLLYVAATRAKKKLHLVGWINNRQDVPFKNSMLERLWPAIAGEFLTQPAAAAPVAAGVRRGIKLRRLVEGWTAPEAPAPLRWRLEETPVEGQEVTFQWSGETLRLVGTLVHRVLQLVAREGLDRWPEERLEAMQSSLRAGLAQLGVPPLAMDDALSRTTSALRSALTSDRGRWLLGTRAESRSEWELAGVFDGKVYAVKLDRTFVDADGVRWIVDYKTGVHEGGGTEKFLDEEQRRYREQLDRYAEIVSRMDNRPIRLGLFFPLMNGWREWEWVRPLPAERAVGSA